MQGARFNPILYYSKIQIFFLLIHKVDDYEIVPFIYVLKFRT